MEDMSQNTETPPLSRSGRRIADAKLAAAKFEPTEDGNRMVRKFEVHGIAVTESVSLEQAKSAEKNLS